MNLVGNHHWSSGQRRLERCGSRLHQRGIGGGQQGCGVLLYYLEAIRIGINTVRGPGYEYPITTSVPEQLVGRISKRFPESPDLLAPTPGKDCQCTPPRRNPETGPGILAGGAREAVNQWVTHIIAPDAEAVEELLFERQHHGQAVHCGREPPGSLRSPGPELRSDVVQNLGACAVGRFRYPEMKTGIVHQYGQVISPDSEVCLQSAQQAIMGADFGDDLDHAKCCEPFHGITNGGPRIFHVGPAQGLYGSAGITLRERTNHGGRMQVSRRFTGGDEDARRAPLQHQWVEAASGWV